ncbi:tyrosine-type recombinase/integrase [Oceanobacillus sojae]|uniref:tyrosine-type recombinase/integrase n=1 Tax=Oceanobacillus sojae TaxID=582851 RepID=UPI003633C60F
MARRKNVITSGTDVVPGELQVNPSVSFVDFETAMNAFLSNCKLRNLSEYTVNDYYRTELLWFRKVLEEQGIPTDPSSITLEIIENNIIVYLMETKKCKATTLNTMIRALRIFFKFLLTKEMIESNPLEDLRLLKTEKNVIETFTREELKNLFVQPNQGTFTGIRDLTIMSLFVETGIRLREMVEVKVRDIRWEDSQILIKGKNREDRLVPFQASMLRLLKRWVALRGEVDHDFLFINIDNGPLSKRQLQSRITKYGRMAGIKGVRCSPHTLRHTFAKMAVINGANVFHLQKILGHSTLDMVKVYVNLFSMEVADSHKKFSPLESLNRIK